MFSGEMPVHKDVIPQHGLTSVGPTEEWVCSGGML